MVNLILRLPPDKHKQFKNACTNEGKYMNEVANRLIEEYLLKKKAIA
ncbi:hypothetical protein IKE67_06215 [bacterium]|nr:hypothetical protein [bacterium]